LYFFRKRASGRGRGGEAPVMETGGGVLEETRSFLPYNEKVPERRVIPFTDAFDFPELLNRLKPASRPPIGYDFPGQAFPDAGDEAEVFFRGSVEIDRDKKNEQLGGFHSFNLDLNLRGRGLAQGEARPCFEHFREGTGVKLVDLADPPCPEDGFLQRGWFLKEIDAGMDHVSLHFDGDIPRVLIWPGRGRDVVKPDTEGTEKGESEDEKGDLLIQGEVPEVKVADGEPGIEKKRKEPSCLSPKLRNVHPEIQEGA